MATKKVSEVQWGKAKETGVRASKTDELKDDARSRVAEARDSRRPPHKIKPRAQGNTRELDPLHVVDLAQSIEALGLLQPIAIDIKDHLVAGEHRLFACQLLSTEDPEARVKLWESIQLVSSKRLKSPQKLEEAKKRILALNYANFKDRYHDLEVQVVVLPFDSEQSHEQAILSETAENEKRQDYTKDEILSLAKKLRKAGYIERPGRPRSGEKSIKTALTVISGKSWRQICRDLEEDKTMTRVIVSEEVKDLEKISKCLERFSKKYPDHKFVTSFLDLNHQVRRLLDEQAVTSDK